MTTWRIRSLNELTTSLLDEGLGGVSDTCIAAADESMSDILRRDILAEK
jgi:hypothetical protein